MRAVARKRKMASVMRTWTVLRSPADRAVVLQAAFLLPAISGGLRTIGWVRMKHFLDRPPEPMRESAQEARHIGGLVEAVVRRSPIRFSCLPRSIVLWRILRRRGLEAQLRFGVRKEGIGDHRFHAWVEHAGTVLNDAPHVRERFTPFHATRDGSEAS